jgi:photosystem II stability/assembly factor-like uncharacterized protein
MRTLITLLLLIAAAVAQDISHVAALGDSNLRGLSVVNDQVVWVSGSKGTIARTTDEGKSWQRITPPTGAEAFDFRDVEAFSAKTAYVMSAGLADQSRIWKTNNGGKSWRQQYTNGDKDFFLDSLACWNKKHCVALSDPVGGKFLVLMTDDGEHWRELPRDHMPPAIVEKRKTSDGKDEDLKEGAFAASGTAIAVFGPNIWFGTGGPKARVFHSADRGKTWTVAETPIMHGEASQGIFSIVFRDATHGVIVGGDYKQAEKTDANIAITADAGKEWLLIDRTHLPYCSAVAFAGHSYAWITGGRQGVFDVALAFDGTTVTRVELRPFNSIAQRRENAPESNGNRRSQSFWLVGPDGAILHQHKAQ